MGRPMPDEMRSFMQAKHHPARSVPCSHCGAAENRPCRSRRKTRVLPQPHPARVSAWVRATAICPVCQVAPGVDCQEAGQPIHGGDVHPRRQTEAEETAA